MKNISLKLVPLTLIFFLVMCNDDSYKISSEVKEGAKPVASFIYEIVDLEVQFTGTSTDAESYYWDFGDGTSSTEASPLHTFSSAGIYTITLKVNSPAGYSSQVEKSFSVSGKVSAFYQYTARRYREGGFGRIIDFDATSSANAVSITWDFGDGVVIENADFSLTHEFPDFGTYNVKITTIGYLGDEAVYEIDIEVVPDFEMIKGGGMDETDAIYWSIKGTGYPVEFGYNGDGPSGGNGGCLRFVGRTNSASHTTAVYQAIDVVEGEKFQLDAQVKWDADGFSNGVLFWCIAGPAGSADFEGDGVTPTFTDDNLFISSFNDWVANTPIPPYDNDLSGNNQDGTPYGYGYNGPGRYRNGGSYGVYIAPFTGTIYLGIELRNVWGQFYKSDFLFDEISFKLIPE
ncbi:MAG: PKD domain-containing protein [Tannerellaceae bacterium]|jgi:PKD repeat protein|nr:PKD domain-containing protein [Tannerellaceae bacterium]